MSMNHYSSSDFPETTQWWSSHHTTMADSSPKTTSSSSSNNHHHHKPDDNSSSAAFWLTPHHLYHAAGGAMFCRQNYNTNTNNNDAAAGGASFDLNSNEDEEEVARGGEKAGIPKDRLFEKPLTPSDVGKLNRLVIPKQHAEKHFPLNGGDSGENGLLLGFEDEVGKSWRFRYSYWNSSQSYVLTKGWSRFVKEKRLDAGDIVVFARHRVDSGRLFIGWRRRNSAGCGNDGGISQPSPPVANGGVGWNRAFYTAQPYPTSRGGQYQIRQSSPLPNYQQQSPDQYSGSVVPIVQKQTTAAASSGNPKRLRLFGVNMECQLADDVSEPSTPVGSPMSSNPYHHHHHHQYYSKTAHMDISFSGGDDVYRQG